MGSLRSRPAGPEDLDRLSGLVCAYYQDDPGAWPMSPERAADQIRRMLARPAHVFPRLLEVDGEVVGYCLLVPYFSNEFGGDIVWLDELYLRPERRGQGLADAFLDHLHRELAPAAGWVRVELEVHDGNTRARRLYERHGYHNDGRTLLGVQLRDP